MLDPALESVSGRYFEGLVEIRSSAESYDEAKAAALWEESAELVGLRDDYVVRGHRSSLWAGEHRARPAAGIETGAMESNGLTYTFRTADGWAFRLPPGSAVMVGRKGGGADIQFSHPPLSRHHSRWVNGSDICTMECLNNRWWVTVNGRPAPTTGITLKAGDLIELVPGLTLTVDVETTDRLGT